MDNDIDKLNNDYSDIVDNGDSIEEKANSNDDGNNQDSKTDKKDKKKKNKGKQRNYWPLIITMITFCLSLLFSLISELATKPTGLVATDIIIAIILLCLLIITSIIFDGIGVSVTSCDLAPLNSMAARKVPHAKIAIMLVKNASKVNNICADVIGDICGIVSGACGASLVVSIMALAEGGNGFVIAILVSAFIAAFTVGGKAVEKTIAIKRSQDIVLLAARVIGIFYKPDRKNKKNARKDK